MQLMKTEHRFWTYRRKTHHQRTALYVGSKKMIESVQKALKCLGTYKAGFRSYKKAARGRNQGRFFSVKTTGNIKSDIRTQSCRPQEYTRPGR